MHIVKLILHIPTIPLSRNPYLSMPNKTEYVYIT